MSVARPRFSPEEALVLASSRFGLSGQIRPLPSDRDQNYLLITSSGQGFVLKIASLNETRKVLELQQATLQLLAQSDQGPLFPRVCPGLAGETLIEVADAEGQKYWTWMLTYLPGLPFAKARHHSPALLHDLGFLLGKIDQTLYGFDHPGAHRAFPWDLRHAREVILQHQTYFTPTQRTLIDPYLSWIDAVTLPLLPRLRHSIIYHDANDYNILINTTGPARDIVGLIDFGDMIHTCTVAELAIGAAYAMLDKPDPLAVAATVAAGYHEAFPLTEPEIAALYGLICLRLCLSVAMSAHQQRLEPDNDYLRISEEPVWALLERLQKVPPRLAHYTFRKACGLPACPQGPAVVAWLARQSETFGPVILPDVRTTPPLVLDLSVGSRLLGRLLGDHREPVLSRFLAEELVGAGAAVGVGRYDEARSLYASPQFGSSESGGQEARTVHLGIDLFAPAGTPIFAPLTGRVHSLQDNALPLDYGPTLLLEHQIPETDLTFYTLYGHLSREVLAHLSVGQVVRQGEEIAWLGDPSVNGGWPPHLHFQIILDLLDLAGNFPGVAAPGERDLWLDLCPDPNLVLGIPAEAFPAQSRSQEDLLISRKKYISPNLSLSYRQPIHMVRGFMQYLYDADGRAYLDAVNNVPHVGHCHPEVVRAGQEQMAVLNTNTRYLHENLVRYAERLCATLPEPLQVCFFVNSGSEANDLALRLARAHTGHRGVIVLDGAYHGHLSTLIDISPYKFMGPGGEGVRDHVRVAVAPDPYRGLYRGKDTARDYARHVDEAIRSLQEASHGVAAFIGESLLSCGGQIECPPGYFEEVYRLVREAGGVCIADEVQVGFGRVGSHFWGFETQAVVPDIVTMGKPIGNGHPLAAVVTTPEVAASFQTGMEYFNTFGGNPVSCAIGLAVLEVMAREGLQARALEVGTYLKDGLTRLMDRHPLIGDVRGRGLFLGVELVQDRLTLTPAAEEARYVAERMAEQYVLLSTDGPFHNVLKIKPPLVFTHENADTLIQAMDQALGEWVRDSGQWIMDNGQWTMGKYGTL